MRSINDARKRWNTIFERHKSITSLKHDTARRPSHAGLRSICWKIFLLYPDITPSNWIETLRSERRAYSELHEHHLKNRHGESVFEATDLDPLAEDESNPYELYRKDEELRQEIFQDIERCMPENTFFREPKVQDSLLEILFIYCKLNQDVSYRQGFHELAAIVYWVVACDAISPDSVVEPEDEISEDESIMREVLDSKYINHDTFSIFQCVMRSAKAWYELGENNGGSRKGGAVVGSSAGPIVQKSQYIHETLLMATDPELAEHLKALDVLPQVFLIRWIRLLFCREFPFDELLSVWDLIFAEDPELHLVDLICVSMLLRIRWKLIEADYSTALTLLLRYPSPSVPVTLVEDAMYLRDNLSPGSGKHIITKYSKRSPAAHQPRPAPQKPKHPRRPMSPSMKPLFQTGQIESIVQDVARNVLYKSEKWGVNRAVREAVVEVKKNVQGYQQPQHKQLANTKEEELAKLNRELTKRLQAEEERRRQLARILDTSLGVLSNENVQKAEKEDAMKRISHVKECLLDGARSLDRDLLQPSTPPAVSPKSKSRRLSTSTTKHDQTLPSTTSSRPKPPVSPPGTFVKTSFKNNSDPDFISLAQRPRATLAQSSFAWMLGDDPVSKYRSGFVESNKDEESSKSMDALKGEVVGSKARLGLLVDPDDEGFDLGDFKKS
ncbi:RabGAP/TBC [Wilcoxina mikolae CBS 423.85]|nr:RabGAP/TBC [Wilcoxina mikolae CBS 423.85]